MKPKNKWGETPEEKKELAEKKIEDLSKFSPPTEKTRKRFIEKWK